MSRLLVSRSSRVAAAGRELERVVVSALPLVIEGETGTGKSDLARRIHARTRAPRPLVVMDCGEVPASLVPGALFGHRAGAFTDATRPRQGWLARAGDGTLVVDRLEVAPQEVQVALLRVLEERRFTPLGATAPQSFGARLIALADAGLDSRLEVGAVRRDLYHRLAGYHLRLPPLRERREDILPAARATLRRLARRTGRRLVLGEDAAALLESYPWPGNFRELTTVLERAVLTATGERIELTALRLTPTRWEPAARAAAERWETLEEVTRRYTAWVLAAERGNLTRAARRLGISRRTLMRWRKRDS